MIIFFSEMITVDSVKHKTMKVKDLEQNERSEPWHTDQCHVSMKQLE